MPWMPDGRALWDFIAPHDPTILSALREDIHERCAPQKLLWVERELGQEVRVLVVRHGDGKAQIAESGDILIDDDPIHRLPWLQAGGIFIHYRSTQETIAMLKLLGIGA
jgi:hypothetical protein